MPADLSWSGRPRSSNRYANVGSNLQLFLGTVAWLVDESAQLAPPPTVDDNALELTAWVQGWLCLWSALFLPGCAGLMAWRARRRQRAL